MNEKRLTNDNVIEILQIMVMRLKLILNILKNYGNITMIIPLLLKK